MDVILDLEACPHCGKEDYRIMGRIIDEQVRLGNMSEKAQGFVQSAMYSCVDPLKPPLAGSRIPAIRVFTDLCNKCGRAVNFMIEQGHGTLPLRPGGTATFA